MVPATQSLGWQSSGNSAGLYLTCYAIPYTNKTTVLASKR